VSRLEGRSSLKDNCCLSRLTDDQSQLGLLSKVRRGIIDLISSEALEDEARQNPSIERRTEIQTLLSLAAKTVEIDGSVEERARELSAAGYGLYDALHLAAAESAGVDVLLTTDDRFFNRAARGGGSPRISVGNPVSWIQAQEP
jgi:predicted nucleic acid-binding protein